MDVIVEILLQPVLSGLDGGRVQWPTVGLLLAWLVVAALLGALLHRMREPAGGIRGRRGRPRSIVATTTARPRRAGALPKRPAGAVVSS